MNNNNFFVQNTNMKKTEFDNVCHICYNRQCVLEKVQVKYRRIIVKKKLNRIFSFSFVFLIGVISFVKVTALEVNDKNNSIHLTYEVKEKEEVLIKNQEIFEFYKMNYKELKRLIAEKQRQEEIKKEQERIEFKNTIAEFSKQFIGNPYVSGGTSLTNGADCSGFVQTIFKTFGYKLPRTTSEQASIGTGVLLEDIEVGDIISYGYGSYVTHSALYIGNNKIIHASTPEGGIRIDNINIIPIVTIRRVI